MREKLTVFIISIVCFIQTSNNVAAHAAIQAVACNGSTNYIVTFTDANQCSATDNVMVVVAPAGSGISIYPPNPTICSNGSVQLTASGAFSFQWSPSIGLSSDTGSVVTASISQVTTYTVTGVTGLSNQIVNPIAIGFQIYNLHFPIFVSGFCLYPPASDSIVFYPNPL
ncbi:MAG: hypothetical protein KKA07_07315 [Bacteroidetes bacterium]|nr:hypothetical protein [Bacteroidota bacterium]